MYKSKYSTEIFLIGFIGLVLFSGLAFANSGPANVGAGNGTAGNATAIGPCVVNLSNIPQNASNQTIAAAKTYVAEKLGQGYFNKYVNYTFSGVYNSSCLHPNGTVTKGNITYSVFFDYNIPFLNGSTIRAYQNSGGPVFLVGVWVTLDQNNTVIGYRGPMKPYVITVSAQNATEVALASGLSNITRESIVSAYNFLSNNTGSAFVEYKIVWSVYSGNRISCGGNNAGNTFGANICMPGVYVDVETGKIVGEFLVNPSIVQPLGGSSAAVSPAPLGNFSIFQLTGTTSTASTSPTTVGPTTTIGGGAGSGYPNQKLLLVIILVAAGALTIGWYLRSRHA